MKIKSMIVGLALGSVLGLAVVETVGCKHIDWTPDLVYKTTYCVGVTGGAFVSAQKYPAEVVNATLEIADLLRVAVPTEGQTLTQAWTPIVDAYLAKTDKVPEEYKPLVRDAVKILTTAYDIEKVKHPEIAQGEEYVRQGMYGLLDGYTTFVKPANRAANGKYRKPRINYDLYRELGARFGK